DVEVRTAHRVAVAGHLNVLVCPTGVPDPDVDRRVNLFSGSIRRHSFGLHDLVDELCATPFEQLGDAVEHLAAVVAGRTGPAGHRRPGRPHGVAGILAGCLGDVGEESTGSRSQVIDATRLTARELATDVELVRLGHGEAGHFLAPLVDFLASFFAGEVSILS